MPSQSPNGLNLVVVVGAAILAWYLYQIGSRKRVELRYRLRRTVVGLLVYFGSAVVLIQQGLPPLEAVVLGLLAGMGFAWLLLKPPRRSRRIPKAIRRQVIERDLTRKGLKWDSSKHHIDHFVPFSRDGDNSPRNLSVVEKRKNLRKGGKMPSFFDFLRK